MEDAMVVTRQVADATPARALAGLLGLDPEDVADGALLRPMWQLVHLAAWPSGALGPDGHGRHELPTPPAPGLRRMFAGGRLTLRPGIRLGEELAVTTAVTGRRTTQGRSGRAHFVTTRAEVAVGGEVVLEDERDIVYLAAAPRPSAQATEVAAEADAVQGRLIDVDPVLLFRFSALTCNAHRIHYDANYCREVEGYPGLVVHGPLQALLMAEEATTRLAGPLGTEFPAGLQFDYRLVAPLFAGQGLVVGGHGSSGAGGRRDEVEVAVADGAGRVTATGRMAATPGDPR